MIGNHRVLVNVPNLRVKGGVTNYFNALRLSEHGDIAYFFVNREAEGNWISKSFFPFFLSGRFSPESQRVLIGASQRFVKF